RVMIYGAGEAIQRANALAPQIEAQLSRLQRIATNRYVAAVAQLDSSNAPTLRFVLDPWGRQPKQQVANVNTGDPAELLKFVTWGSSICPAERTVLVLSGHGAAWEDNLADQVLGIAGAAGTRVSTSVRRVPGALHNARVVFGRDVSKWRAMTRAVLVDGGNRD